MSLARSAEAQRSRSLPQFSAEKSQSPDPGNRSWALIERHSVNPCQDLGGSGIAQSGLHGCRVMSRSAFGAGDDR